MPKRIMVLGLRGFPNVQGGVETHCEALYPRIVNLGFKVEILTRSPYVDKSLSEWKGVRFHRLWAPSINGVEALLHSLLGVLYAAKKRPDVLHIHAIGPAIVTPLARLFGIKVVVTHHGPDYDREKWGIVAKSVLIAGEWMGMRFSNRRIVISKVIRSLVLDKYGKSSDLIPNGVKPPMATASVDRLREFHLSRGKYVLLVSRMVPEKRHIDLIQAFQKSGLTDWKLVLVGDLSAKDDYVQLVRTEAEACAQGNIVLTGFKSGSDLAELQANAGIFVLPSSHEGLPIALLEAMSYGIPVLASDIDAHLELELDQRCYFKLGKVDALAERLVYVASSPEFQKEQAALGTMLVREHYDWDKVASQTATLYSQISHTP